MVHKCQKTGDCASPEVRKVAKEIDREDAKDFAKTKHKGLPEKVEETSLGFKNWLLGQENFQMDFDNSRDGVSGVKGLE